MAFLFGTELAYANSGKFKFGEREKYHENCIGG